MNKDKPAENIYTSAGLPLDDTVDVPLDFEEYDKRFTKR